MMVEWKGMLQFSDSVTNLKGIGPVRAEALRDRGVVTIKDLLWYAPFRYQPIIIAKSWGELEVKQSVSIRVQIIKKTLIKTRKFKSFILASCTDGAEKRSVSWFNAPHILSTLKEGEWYHLVGSTNEYQGKISLTNPAVYRQDPGTGSLVPLYHESEVLSSRWIRACVAQALEDVEIKESAEASEYNQEFSLISLATALKWLHQPSEQREIDQAYRKLGFDELYQLFHDIFTARKAFENTSTRVSLQVKTQDIEAFSRLLPYELSASQQQAIAEIAHDLSLPHPMHRLLLGEVGSGKTTAAAFALWVAARSGAQAIMVCPTNILVSQHAATLRKILEPAGLTVGEVTGAKKEISASILVGTHALLLVPELEPAVVVVDEEHRFGVAQREHFLAGKKKPHFLSMTATPIPRTVALTTLADRNVSRLEPRHLQTNITTWVVPSSKRKDAYAWIQKTLQETQGQGLVVCPFIDDSLVDTLSSVKSATTEFAHLQKIWKQLKLLLLHGRMKEAEKQAIFSSMRQKEADMLVTTPVVEVGVDLPHANCIVIEGAERFGLAQLHQLRGRVGRRGQPAFCLLFTSPDTDGTPARLALFAKTYQGEQLAEYDLKHRGSGELLGVVQHGFDQLRFADWFDTELLSQVRELVVKQHNLG